MQIIYNPIGNFHINARTLCLLWFACVSERNQMTKVWLLVIKIEIFLCHWLYRRRYLPDKLKLFMIAVFWAYFLWEANDTDTIFNKYSLIFIVSLGWLYKNDLGSTKFSYLTFLKRWKCLFTSKLVRIFQSLTYFWGQKNKVQA